MNGGNPDLSGQCVFLSSQPLKDFLRDEQEGPGDCKHGDEIPFFAIENYKKYESLMTRAQSLTVGGTIHIRMCRVAAQGHGLNPADIHGFVEIAPMADAEIVRLQQEEGYADMQ